MTEPEETRPETIDEDTRLRRRMAVIYAVVAVLLLASCCVSAVWFTHYLRDALLTLIQSG
jgi:hypothetical protein